MREEERTGTKGRWHSLPLRPRSLAWRILLAVLAVNLLIDLLVIVSVPHLFYHYLKKEAVKQSVVDMQSLGVASNVGFFLFISFKNSDSSSPNSRSVNVI